MNDLLYKNIVGRAVFILVAPPMLLLIWAAYTLDVLVGAVKLTHMFFTKDFRDL